MRRAAALLLAAACSAPPPPVAAVERKPQLLAARLPQREELVCFPCHSHVRFEKGPPFAHGLMAHRNAGHCHVCHQGQHHEGRAIDRGACLTCHDEKAQAWQALARVDRKRK